MNSSILLALAGSLTVAGTSEAQRFVGRDTVSSLPQPVLLPTSGMFQAMYATVGEDVVIAGQPTERALREMKAQGVTTVINLRMPQEMRSVGFDEERLVAELGMRYVHIPMRGGSGEMSYSPQTLAQFTDVMKSAEGKVLLHCTIAWRASHIWAAHLIQLGVADEEAVQHARAINLMDDHRADPSGRQPLEMFLDRRVTGIGRPR